MLSSSTSVSLVATVSSDFIATMYHSCLGLELEEMWIYPSECDLLVQISTRVPFFSDHFAENVKQTMAPEYQMKNK